jgi:hypothetical protein
LNHLVIARDNIMNVWQPVEQTLQAPFDNTAGTEYDRIKTEFVFDAVQANKRPVGNFTDLGYVHAFVNTGTSKIVDSQSWASQLAVYVGNEQELTIMSVVKCAASEVSVQARRHSTAASMGASYQADINFARYHIGLFTAGVALSFNLADDLFHTWILQYRPLGPTPRSRLWIDGKVVRQANGPVDAIPQFSNFTVGGVGAAERFGWNGEVAHVQLCDRWLGPNDCIRWAGSPFEVLYRPARRQISVDTTVSIPTAGDIEIDKFIGASLDVSGITKGSIDVEEVVDGELDVDEVVTGNTEIKETVTGTLEIEPAVIGSLEIE